MLVSGTCGSLESPVKMERSKPAKRGYTISFLASIDEISKGINYQYHIFSQDRFGSGTPLIINPIGITEIITSKLELSPSTGKSSA